MVKSDVRFAISYLKYSYVTFLDSFQSDFVILHFFLIIKSYYYSFCKIMIPKAQKKPRLSKNYQKSEKISEMR